VIRPRGNERAAEGRAGIAAAPVVWTPPRSYDMPSLPPPVCGRRS